MRNLPFWYKVVRPIMVRGDVQNTESVASDSVVAGAIQLENNKKSYKLITQFYDRTIHEIFFNITQMYNIKTVLDVGTALGDVVSKVALQNSKVDFLAIDIMDEAIRMAQSNYRGISNLKFKKSDFGDEHMLFSADVVMCLQTLEHVEDHVLIPFLEKIFRVARYAVVLSVPREPYWCIANLVRLKYWSRLGNTPHHRQHWKLRGFEDLCCGVASQMWDSEYEVVRKSPLCLWSILEFRKKC